MSNRISEYYRLELSTTAKEAASKEFDFEAIDANSQLWVPMQDCTLDSFVKNSFSDGSHKHMVIVTVDEWKLPKKGLQDSSGK